MTTAIDSLDTIAIEPTTRTVDDPTVILALGDRTVTFTGRQVSAITDLSGPLDPTGRQFHESTVYLTGKGKVAIHHVRRRTLAVYDLDDFVAKFAATPVSWIVNDVLDALPRPIEHLDI
jgi:hypothetical protein